MASEGPDIGDHSCLWDGLRAELAWPEVTLCPLAYEAVVAVRHQNHVDLSFMPSFVPLPPVNYDSPMCHSSSTIHPFVIYSYF